MLSSGSIRVLDFNLCVSGKYGHAAYDLKADGSKSLAKSAVQVLGVIMRIRENSFAVVEVPEAFCIPAARNAALQQS